MSCQGFKELRSQIWLTTGISHYIFAEVAKVSKSTYERWDDDSILKARDVDYFIDAMDCSFKEIVNRIVALQESNSDEKTYQFKILFTEDDWCKLKNDHYAQWKEHYEERKNSLQRQEQGPLASLQTDAPHFLVNSVILKLLRWQDERKAPKPLYVKSIGEEGSYKVIGVQDESVVYHSYTLGRPVATTIEATRYTSGYREPLFFGPGEPELHPSSYTTLSGKRTRIRYTVTETDRQILYAARVYNAYQRNHEWVSVQMIPNSTSDLLCLTVDFASVIDERPFTKKPEAYYETEPGKLTSIQSYHSDDLTVWYVNYDDPDPDSRIILSWSLL